MSICKRKLFKALFAAITVGTGAWLLTGCKKVDVHIDDTAVLHEGYDLPQLIVGSAGTAKWENEDTNNKLVAGEHTYKYVYTESSTQKRQTFTVKLNASQHTCDETKPESTRVIKEASCTENGIKYHICDICNEQYNQQSIEKLGHNFENIEHVDGDCMNLGYTYQICARCNEKKKDDSGEAIKTYDTVYGQHIWATDDLGNEVIHDITVQPQCNAKGEAVVYCKFHGEHVLGQGNTENIEKAVVLDEVQHNYSKEVHTDGNCMTKGYTEYKCQWCDIYKLVDGSEEHFKTIDENYGAHVWETNTDGSEQIHEITTQPECDKEGSGIVWCQYHEQHVAGEGLTTGIEKTVVIHPVEHNYIIEVYTPGSCIAKGYTEYKCQWCDELKKVEGSTTETYKTIDENYGDHTFAVDEDGSLIIDHIEAYPTCTEDGIQIAYCVNHGYHVLGEGLQTTDYQTLTIHALGHDYSQKDYHPYLTTTCRTLGFYRNVCTRCGEADPEDADLYESDEYPFYTVDNVKKVYPHQDTTYLDHHYDADGLCDTIYYQQFTTPEGKISYYTRICMMPKDKVEGIFNLGGSPRVSETDGQYHAGTYNDPSDTIVGILTKIYNQQTGEFTGYYSLNIVSTEQDEEGLGAGSYNCYAAPNSIHSAAADAGSSDDLDAMDIWFEVNGADFIPWYNERDEFGNLYRERISTISVDGAIKTLPAGLFYKDTALQAVYFSGNGSLEELPTAIFIGCSNLQELRLNDRLETIGYASCYGCSKLTTEGLTLPRGIVTIDNFAFEKCNLTVLDFSECYSLEKIGRYAFVGNKIIEVTLPSNDIELMHGNSQNYSKSYHGEEGSFDFDGYCIYVNDELNTEEIEEQGEFLKNVFQHDVSVYFLGKDKEASKMITTINGVQILVATEENPISVKSALKYNENHPYETRTFTDGFIICNTLDKTITQAQLEEVLNTVIGGKMVKENLVYIGNSAFELCRNITRFEVPATVVAIGDAAFKKTSLEEIGVLQANGHLDFDETLAIEYIGAVAFEGTNITEITIPQTIKTLGGNMLMDCFSLKVINYDTTYQHLVIHGNFAGGATEMSVAVYDISGAFGATNSQYVVTVNVGSHVRYLGDCFKYFGGKGCDFNFENATALEYVLGTTFYNCTITTLDLTNTAITAIDANTFKGNTTLKEIILPNGCVSVGASAFENCTKLTNVVFGTANVNVSDTAFKGCTGLRYVEVHGDMTLTVESNGALYTGVSGDTNEYTLVIGKEVEKLPFIYNLASTAKVTTIIELAYETDHYVGFGIEFNGEKYVCTADFTKIIRGAANTVFVNVDIDEDITGTSFITDLPTDLATIVNIGEHVGSITANYFAGANCTINLSSLNNHFVWQEKGNLYYCGLENTFGETFQGKVLVDGKEAIFKHKWNESEYIPATCQHESSGSRICEICSAYDNEVTPILEHNYVLDAENCTATCSVEGTITYRCSMCGATTTEQGFMPHTPKATTVTCFETGAKVVCEVCNADVFNTTNQGHYYFDEEANEYCLIDLEHTGTTCAICGKEVTIEEVGTDGVVAQLTALNDEYLSAIVVATAAGKSANASNPLWSYHKVLDEIYIGDTITTIGTAFFDCPSGPDGEVFVTRKLVVGENVNNIGTQGLANLCLLEELYFNCTNLTSVKTSTQYWPFMWNGYQSEKLAVYIGENVTQIPNYCFAGCVATEVHIPTSVKTISSNAFVIFGYQGQYVGLAYGDVYYAGSVKEWSEINWNASLSTLDSTNPLGNGQRIAFNGATEFTSKLVIPADMTSLEAFQLTFLDGTFDELEVEEGNPTFKAVNGCLIDVANKTIVFSVYGATIPDDESLVTTIGMSAFATQRKIYEVLLPENITTIEQYAYTDTPTVYYLGTKEAYQAISGYKNINETAYYYVDLTGLTTEQIQAFETGEYWTYNAASVIKQIPNGHDYVAREVTEQEQAQCIKYVDVCTICGYERMTYVHNIPEAVAYDCQVGGTLTYKCATCGQEVTGPTNGHGHYDSLGNIITTGGQECAYCHKFIIDVIDYGDNGVICQVVADTKTSSTYTAWVISIGEGTVIRNYSSRGNGPLYKAYQNKIDTLIFGDEITVIGNGSFGAANGGTSYPDLGWINLKKVYLGKGITTLGTYAFYGIDRCEELYINSNINDISSSSNYNFSYVGFLTEYGCTLYVGKDVTVLPTRIIQTNGAVTAVVFEKGSVFTTINSYAFYYESVNLEAIVIPKTLTTIAASNAFRYVSTSIAVYYTGTADEWATTKAIANMPSSIKNSPNIFFYSETQPEESGNYWHYDVDGFTPVIWSVE